MLFWIVENALIFYFISYTISQSPTGPGLRISFRRTFLIFKFSDSAPTLFYTNFYLQNLPSSVVSLSLLILSLNQPILLVILLSNLGT
jgi:hypothetical protein